MSTFSQCSLCSHPPPCPSASAVLLPLPSFYSLSAGLISCRLSSSPQGHNLWKRFALHQKETPRCAPAEGAAAAKFRFHSGVLKQQKKKLSFSACDWFDEHAHGWQTDAAKIVCVSALRSESAPIQKAAFSAFCSRNEVDWPLVSLH